VQIHLAAEVGADLVEGAGVDEGLVGEGFRAPESGGADPDQQ
jgi:hypothetical protein